jgi:hypothetical protein
LADNIIVSYIAAAVSNIAADVLSVSHGTELSICLATNASCPAPGLSACSTAPLDAMQQRLVAVMCVAVVFAANITMRWLAAEMQLCDYQTKSLVL